MIIRNQSHVSSASAPNTSTCRSGWFQKYQKLSQLKSILQRATIVRETSCFPCETPGWTGWQRPKMKGSHQNHKLFGSQTMVAAFRKMYSIVLRPASTRSGNRPGWHGPAIASRIKINKKNKQTNGEEDIHLLQ